MKFDLINSQINFIKQIIERDLDNQANKIKCHPIQYYEDDRRMRLMTPVKIL